MGTTNSLRGDILLFSLSRYHPYSSFQKTGQARHQGPPPPAIKAGGLSHKTQVCFENRRGAIGRWIGATHCQHAVLLGALRSQLYRLELIPQLRSRCKTLPLAAQVAQRLDHALSPFADIPAHGFEVGAIRLSTYRGKPGAIKQDLDVQPMLILKRQAGLGDTRPGVLLDRILPKRIVHRRSIWLVSAAESTLCTLMIILRDLDLRRGGKLLLKDAGVTIQPGQNLALIGANGCGKSSLFSLLLGELGADNGEIEGLAGMRLAHMAQEVQATHLPAGEYVWRGDRELACLRDELQEFERTDDFERAAGVHTALEAIDGYSAERRVARLLTGLGFPEEASATPVSDFSGGWRIRLNLARALMTPSDLLLLDEPTNHLDLDATLWLQQWLQAYPGTLLMISHDRDFIDATCERILHIEQAGLSSYKGNYSDFEKQRAERLANQQAAYEKQERRIAEIDDFVRRFRYKATKAKQAQSRLKELERMQSLAPAHMDSPFDFTFPPAGRSSDPLLRLDGASLGYGSQAVLGNVDLILRPGSRYGLLGKNGAGKSTLLKSLVGELPLLGGERSCGEHCRIGYFDQQQLEALDLEASPLLHLQRLDPGAREQDILNFLGGFNFRGETAREAVAPFSGGEKARLALAIVVWQTPNLLVLDEPTNHLDLEMRHAMEVALQAYEGALILVSHDRHMLRNSAEELLLVHDGSVEAYSDDLDGYERWILTSYRENSDGAERTVESSRREKRQAAAARREKIRPLKQALSTAEAKLAAADTELAELESRLADPDIYGDARKDELADLLRRQGELRVSATELEERWLTLQASLEELESA